MTKPCVLITRAAEDAGKFSRMLEQRGYETFAEPMLTLHPAPGGIMLIEQINVRRTQGIIITSRHGLQALTPHSYLHHIPVFAIGDADTYDAMQRGFAQITIVRDVQALFRAVMTECARDGGALLYVRGKFITHDLSKLFKRQGFNLEELVVYDMRAVEKFSDRLKNRLTKGEIHTATFLSVRTAETFMQIAEAAGLADTLKNINAAVFSDNIAKAAKPEKWRRVAVCAEPNLPSLFAEVDKLMAAD
jgi:uroporphyrinogen-III synthase